MEYRPYWLAREWIKCGHNVTIIAASFSHLRRINKDIVQTFQEDVIDGINYVWIKTPTYERNNMHRVINMLTFVSTLIKYRKHFMTRYNPDCVISSSTYPLDIIPAFMIARLSNARLILEVHDLWPLTPVEIGGMSRWHPFIIIMQLAENFAYRHADRVVSLLPYAKDYMVEHGMAPNKFAYIPNGVVIEEWDAIYDDLPTEHLEILLKIKEQGKYIVGYAGAHGAANALHTLIGAAEKLRDQPVEFILVGNGPEKSNIARAKAEKGLHNVHLLGNVSRESIGTLLGYFDICYLGLRGSPLFRYGVSPNKLMDYMMAAKPIIFSITAANDPVREAKCGISVPAENPKEIANAIIRLINLSEEERKLMGEKGREYVRTHHSYEILSKKFLEILRD